MSSRARRRARRLLIAIAATCTQLIAPPAASEERRAEPVWLRDEAEDLDVLVYAPREYQGAESSKAYPVTVMLHGMCDEPENECPHFAASVTPRSWLICPRARLRCEGGGSIWHYKKRDETVEKSVALVRERFTERLDEKQGRTLIGFSLGAIFGMDLAHRSAGRYPRVVLIGAKVHPFAQQLKRQGVQRIVFASGEHDMMKWHMVSAAKRADRHGVRAEFVSLGQVGHWFPADLTPRMTAILDWVDQPTDAD